MNKPSENKKSNNQSSIENRQSTKDISSRNEELSLVFAGHVDHGKSTILGRLLADTDSLPEGKLEQVKENCKRNSKPFEYAFLLDALKDEQAQGITIDSARVFFETDKRRYLILDAPGHIEFLKNMVTGAARAEAACLVIDAGEGIMENSKRHGYMLSMLGIKQIVVLVNKMDLVDYDQKVYDSIVKDYTKFLGDIDVKPKQFIPVSGREGDNIANHSKKMKWYRGPNVLEVFDEFKSEKLPEDKPFRMPVQGVYKFTRFGDDRRIIAGTVDSGKLKKDDTVVFYPSGKRSKVKTIEAFNRENPKITKAGESTGFTLEEQIYIKRGEMAVIEDEKPKINVTSRIKANIFWLGKKPMKKNKSYHLKLGTSKQQVRIEKIVRVINASNLNSDEDKEKIDRHDVAECILKLEKPIAFDLAHENSKTSRFVIIDDFEISGGGIINESLADKVNWVREKVYLRNYKWAKSKISREERAEKYNQKPTLILLTGKKDVGKKPIAKELEKKLFNDGRNVYFLGIGSLLYGVDADLKDEDKYNNKQEHLRRLAEVSNIMIDAGTILIVTAIELTNDDLKMIKTVVNPDQIEVVWVGDDVTTDIQYDLNIISSDETNKAVNRIKGMLQEKGIVFKPWW